MRLYIQDNMDRIDSLVSTDYLLEPIDSLGEKLAAEAQRRRDRSLTGGQIAEAVYVAHVSGDRILSDRSSLRIREGDAAVIPLGRASVALNQVRFELPIGRQALEHLTFGTDGQASLTPHEGEEIYWFRFTSHGTRRGRSVTHSFELPQATFATMLIALPADQALSSNSAVVEEISSPDNSLPDYWRTADLQLPTSANRNVQWWRVNCAGLPRFALTLQDRDLKLDAADFSLVVQKHNAVYTIAENSIDVDVTIDIEPGNRSLLQFALSSNLRLREVSNQQTGLNWQQVAGGSTSMNLVVVSLPDETLGLQTVSLSAVAQRNDSPRFTLPSIDTIGAFTINGQTALTTIDSVAIQGLDSAGFATERTISADGPKATAAWRIVWFGTSPAINVTAARAQSRWTLANLSIFSMQRDWLSATCQSRFSCDKATANEIRCPVSPGWFVDGVRILPNAHESNVGDDSTQVRYIESSENRSGEIVIQWDTKEQEVQFDLEILAHRSQRQNGKTATIGPQSIITLLDGHQVDNCVIRPSVDFLIDQTQEMIQAQIDVDDLPDWQAALLDSSAPYWLARGAGGRLPSIQFRETLSRFSTATQVNLDHATSQVHYAIHCTPTQSSLSTLSIRWPDEFAGKQLQWKLVGPLGVDSEQPLKPPSQLSRQGDALLLPQPFSQPFVVKASVPFDSSASQVRISLPTCSSADSNGTTIAITSPYALEAGQTGIEVSTTRPQVDWLTDGTTNIDESPVYARIDSRRNRLVTLNRDPDKPKQVAWATLESITHSLHSGQGTLHVANWQIDSASDGIVTIELPSNWTAVSLRANDEERAIGSSPIKILLMAGVEQSIQLKCVSNEGLPATIGRVGFPRPRLSIPVFQRDVNVRIPPTYTTLSSLAVGSTGPRLIDRLLPSSLWRWLVPVGPALASESQPVQLMTATESPQSVLATLDQNLWLGHRTAIASLSIFALLISGCITLLLTRTIRASHWQLALCLACCVVLAPISILPFTQLAFLGVCCAWFFSLLMPVFNYRTSAQTSTSVSKLTTNGSMFALLLAFSFPGVGMAQEYGPLSAPSVDSQPSPTIYGVLIQVDNDGNVAGEYAYVPARLMELLDNPQQRTGVVNQAQIITADYELRIRRDSIKSRARTSDISATYTLQFPDSRSELRLPLNASPLGLNSIRIDGQELELLTNRVIKDFATGEIIVRPKVAGRLSLQLKFIGLTPVELDGQLVTTFSVPPIANSTMRVLTDDQLDVQVDSIGQVQRSSVGTTARLGPVEQIVVRWPKQNADILPLSPSQAIAAQTWVHANGDHLSGVCQLTLEGADSTKEMNVLCDSTWTPVGQHWGDARVVDQTPVALGSLTSYRLQFPASEPGSQRIIRVLLSPTNSQTASTLRIPFLIPQGMAQPPRRLTWSAESNTAWTPDGVSVWAQLQEEEQVSWGGLVLSNLPRTTYEIPTSTFNHVLRRNRAATLPTIEESTHIHLGVQTTTVEYFASYSASSNETLAQLRFPGSYHVERLEVNGGKSNFSIADDYNENVLTLQTASRIAELRLVLSQPTTLNKAEPFPRCLLEATRVDSSEYNVFRDLWLDCKLSDDSALTPNRSYQPTELLDDLKLPVGNAPAQLLAQRTTSMDLTYRLRKQTSEPITSVLLVTEGRRNPNARFMASIPKAEGPEIVCIRLPANIRDQIGIGQLWRRFIPTTDPGRLLLYILLPADNSARTRIELDVPIAQTSSGQALQIPDIALISGKTNRYLALPKSIDGQTVRWLRAGNAIDDGLRLSQFGLNESDYVTYGLNGNLRDVEPQFETRSFQATLFRSEVEIVSLENEQINGSVRYWLDPKGRLSLDVEIPDAASLISVENGASPTQFQLLNDDRTARIQLQPNYLPVNLTLWLQWDRDASGEIPLPRLVSVTETNDSIAVAINDKTYSPTDEQLPPIVAGDIERQWLEIVGNVLPTLRTRPSADMQKWLRNWQPSLLHLEASTIFTRAELPATIAAGVTEDSLSLADVWDLICVEFSAGQMNSWPTKQQSKRVAFNQPATLNKVTLQAIEPSPLLFSKCVAVSLLACGGLLVFSLSRRYGRLYPSWLQTQPWGYWVVLAVASLVFLPVKWPGIFFALISVVMTCSQFIDARRRKRSLAGAT